MYQNFERGACDPHAPYRPAFYGTFELPVPIGGKQRRMLVYVCLLYTSPLTDNSRLHRDMSGDGG